MKSGREHSDYLRDILDAARKALAFVGDAEFAAFAADEKTVFAVIRALEIIGEASAKTPPAVRRQNPNLPWRAMSGIRNRLIHEYFGVDLEVVWKTVREDLPPLILAINRMLDEIG